MIRKSYVNVITRRYVIPISEKDEWHLIKFEQQGKCQEILRELRYTQSLRILFYKENNVPFKKAHEKRRYKSINNRKRHENFGPKMLKGVGKLCQVDRWI